jgi:hypothetical protein
MRAFTIAGLKGSALSLPAAVGSADQTAPAPCSAMPPCSIVQDRCRRRPRGWMGPLGQLALPGAFGSAAIPGDVPEIAHLLAERDRALTSIRP